MQVIRNETHGRCAGHVLGIVRTYYEIHSRYTGHTHNTAMTFDVAQARMPAAPDAGCVVQRPRRPGCHRRRNANSRCATALRPKLGTRWETRTPARRRNRRPAQRRRGAKHWSGFSEDLRRATHMCTNRRASLTTRSFACQPAPGTGVPLGGRAPAPLHHIVGIQPDLTCAPARPPARGIGPCPLADSSKSTTIRVHGV